MTRLLIVSALPPTAGGTGKALMWGGLWRHAAGIAGPGNVRYLTIGRDEPDAATDVETTFIHSPRAPEQLRRVLGLALLRGRPFQEAALTSPRIARALRDEIRAFRPDRILVDTDRFASALPRDVADRTTVYLDDLFSVRYARMLEVARARPALDVDPLGNFASVLPGVARDVVTVPSVRRALLARERVAVQRRERTAPSRYRRVLLINPDEAQALREATGATNVHVVPPLVRGPDVVARDLATDAPRFLFLGALNVPHNDAGLVAYLREGFADLLGRVPGAVLTVVGRGATDSLRHEAARFPGRVELVGHVDDLDAAFARAHALLVPLVFGSGVKIKVLDALARGVPVVATSFGAEGIAHAEGADPPIAVADEWGAFNTAAARWAEPAANRRASDAARRHYATHYAPDVVARAYDIALGEGAG